MAAGSCIQLHLLAQTAKPERGRCSVRISKFFVGQIRPQPIDKTDNSLRHRPIRLQPAIQPMQLRIPSGQSGRNRLFNPCNCANRWPNQTATSRSTHAIAHTVGQIRPQPAAQRACTQAIKAARPEVLSSPGGCDVGLSRTRPVYIIYAGGIQAA